MPLYPITQRIKDLKEDRQYLCEAKEGSLNLAKRMIDAINQFGGAEAFVKAWVKHQEDRGKSTNIQKEIIEPLLKKAEEYEKKAKRLQEDYDNTHGTRLDEGIFKDMLSGLAKIGRRTIRGVAEAAVWIFDLVIRKWVAKTHIGRIALALFLIFWAVEPFLVVVAGTMSLFAVVVPGIVPAAIYASLVAWIMREFAKLCKDTTQEAVNVQDFFSPEEDEYETPPSKKNPDPVRVANKKRVPKTWQEIIRKSRGDW